MLMSLNRFVALLFAAVFTLSTLDAAADGPAKPNAKPNVVFILADDK